MRVHKAGASLLLAATALAACGGEERQQPDFVIRGLEVVFETDAPFAHRPDFPARVESTIATALAYWGGSWSVLEGSTLTLVGAASVSCGSEVALGCYDGDLRVTTRDPGIGTFSCVEETVLVHEVGHAAIGDLNHEDPRWMGMEEVAAALGNRIGYADGKEAACPIYPSVWRHQLGTP